jgi:alkylation response protein AidB-like acyl-CoA dehydrogenase
VRFTEEQLLIRDAARRFAETEIGPRVDEVILSEEFIPRDLYKRMGDLGFIGLMVSKERGGQGAGLTEVCLVTEELSKVAPTFGLLLMCVAPGLAGLEGSDEFCAKYMRRCLSGELVFCGAVTAPEGHTNVSEWQRLATRDGDDYILNGTKLFVSGSIACDLHEVYGLDENGEMKIWVMEGNAPGFTHNAPEVKFGMRGSGGGTVTYKDVRVPASMCFDSEVGDGTFYDEIWLQCATIALGAAEGALAQAVEYAKKRTHNFKPVAQIQAVAESIARLEVQVLAASALVYHAAALFDNPETRADSSMKCKAAKVFVPDVAFNVTKEAVKLHGGLGYHNPRIYHYFADAIATMIADETTEYLLEKIARSMKLAEDFDQPAKHEGE